MKTSNLKFGVMVLAASLALGTVSCRKGCTDPNAINYDEKAKKDDGTCIDEVETGCTVVVKSGFITSDETWTADNVYELAGKVIVDGGATLTIEPGTIIKGRQGTESLASALVIARGSKIMAEGTAAEPIVFTSVLDDICVGEQMGTTLDETDRGKWGGVLILGKAPISAADGDTESQIEGIPATDVYGAFGGTDPADNSGVFKYVSIRHGGALIGDGNEINGLTLGGVGSGTTIDNIEIVANVDDGVEFFGGTVNASNILVSFHGDDGIDIDMNYSGTVDNFVVINAINSDEALEVDGPEGTTYTDGFFTLNNGTVYTFGGAEAHVDFKSKAQGTVNNVSMGQVKVRASYQNDCTELTTDAFTYLTGATSRLIFSSCEFSSVSVYTLSQNNTEQFDCTVFPADQAAAEAVMTSTTATGAATGGMSWTWASNAGKL